MCLPDNGTIFKECHEWAQQILKKDRVKNAEVRALIHDNGACLSEELRKLDKHTRGVLVFR